MLEFFAIWSAILWAVAGVIVIAGVYCLIFKKEAYSGREETFLARAFGILIGIPCIVGYFYTWYLFITMGKDWLS